MLVDVALMVVRRPSRGSANAVDNLRLAMTKEPWSNPADRDATIVRGGMREAVPRATLDKYDMINNTIMPTLMFFSSLQLPS